MLCIVDMDVTENVQVLYTDYKLVFETWRPYTQANDEPNLTVSNGRDP